jgi:hypothetical protein
MSARNSTGFGVVERAAAETPINSVSASTRQSRCREQAAALRRLQNDLGNTPSSCAPGQRKRLDVFR